MTRKAAMNQLFNLIQDEYEIKSAGDIEAALLDMFGSFIEKALEAELDILDTAVTIFETKPLQIQEMDGNLKPFRLDSEKQPSKLHEIEKVHLSLKSFLSVKRMLLELRIKF